MKDFNIYLAGHDKAYSITLNNRVTECDIIIRSIAFRDGFSVDQAFILDIDMLGTLLQNFLSVSPSCVLQVESEGELKTIFESTSSDFSVCTVVAAMLQYMISPESIGVEISIPNIPIQATVFEAANSGIEIQTSIPQISYFISFGGGEAKIQLDAELVGEQKRIFEQFFPPFLLNANVEETQKTSYESVLLPLSLSTSLLDIFYSFPADAQSGFAINVFLDDIRTAFPLKCEDITISVSVKSLGEHVQKTETVNSEILLSTSASATSHMITEPSLHGISLKTSIDSIEMWRYRSLGEVDPFIMSEIDQKSIKDLSYIIL